MANARTRELLSDNEPLRDLQGAAYLHEVSITVERKIFVTAESDDQISAHVETTLTESGIDPAHWVLVRVAARDLRAVDWS